MRFRLRRALVIAATGSLVLATVGCTATSDGNGRTTPTGKATSRTSNAVHLSSLKDRSVTVVADADPVRRAADITTMLFDTAPGVVVLPQGASDTQQKEAVATAGRLHVPLLLAPSAPATGTPTTSSGTPTAGPTSTDSATPTPTPPAAGSDPATPTPTSTASPAADGRALAETIRKLDARWVVRIAGARVPRIDGVRQVTTAEAKSADKLLGSHPIVVIVSDPAADLAGKTTARLAGATIVEMPAGASDPGVAPKAIDALAKSPTAPAVLLGSSFGALKDADYSVAAARTGWQLPDGGQRPFTGHRYVALYGVPGSPVLGVLGEQDPAATIARVKALTAQYAPLSDEPVVPAIEVIATVAAGQAGADGNYSNELPIDELTPMLDAARDAHVSVIIDLQPGRTDFLTQAKEYEQLLARPDVGLALDPEWRLKPGEVPLDQIGSVSAAEVNSVTDWLSALVKKKNLPPKMFVLHQFRFDMLPERDAIDFSHPELDPLIHVDGQGTQPEKQVTWNALHEDAPPGVAWGWKNFIDEDKPMLTPEQTMTEVKPTPDLITYQ